MVKVGLMRTLLNDRSHMPNVRPAIRFVKDSPLQNRTPIQTPTQPLPFHGTSSRSAQRISMSIPKPMMPIRMIPMMTISVF